MSKEVYSIKELRELGYPRNMLQRLSHSEEFHKVGFRDKRNIYFIKQKLEKYLERKTEWQY